MNITATKIDYSKTAHKIISKVQFVQHFNQAPDALLVLDSENNLLMLDDLAKELLGYTNDEVRKLTIENLIPSWSDVMFEACIGEPFNREYPINTQALSKAGNTFNVKLKLNVVSEQEEIFLLVAISSESHNGNGPIRLEDVSSKLGSITLELDCLPNPAVLSGLLNPDKLTEVLTREASISKENNTLLLAALINLDNFKLVNNTYGRKTGNSILRFVAKTIKNKTRPVDWVGRIGGDEFLVFLPCKTIFTGACVAEEIRIAIEQTSFTSGNLRIPLTASIGIVSLPFDISSIEHVLSLTKASLKESKEGGKNSITVDDGIFGRIIRIPAKSQSN